MITRMWLCSHLSEWLSSRLEAPLTTALSARRGDERDHRGSTGGRSNWLSANGASLDGGDSITTTSSFSSTRSSTARDIYGNGECDDDDDDDDQQSSPSVLICPLC